MNARPVPFLRRNGAFVCALQPKERAALRVLVDVGAVRLTSRKMYAPYRALIRMGLAERFNMGPSGSFSDVRIVRHATITNHRGGLASTRDVAAPSIPVDGAAVSSRGVA